MDDSNGSVGVHAPLRVFIHGGCISRDSVEFADTGQYHLVRYLARHSILAAGTDATGNIPALDIPSNFQRRMVEFDVKGNLVGDLRKVRHCDAVLWDLVVERNGVYEFDDGSIVTNSAELRKADRKQHFLAGARLIEFATEEHFNRWAGSATMYANILKELNLMDRFVVLAPEWAVKYSNGKATGRVQKKTAAQFNDAYGRYYSHLEKIGFEVLRFDDTVADPNHKWGKAPFHFERAVYDAMNCAVGTRFTNAGESTHGNN